MTAKRRQICFLINVAIVILEITGFYIALSRYGIQMMGYYTQESNLLLMLGCAAYAFLLKKAEEIPEWAILLKYIATSLISVTFVVAMTVLVPMAAPAGKAAMLHMACGGANLYHHLLCPVLAISSFLFLEPGKQLGIRENIFAAVPTLCYAIVTVLLNAFYVIHGPYPFLYVHEQSVGMSVMWFIVILSAGYLFAFVIRLISRKRVNQRS